VNFLKQNKGNIHLVVFHIIAQHSGVMATVKVLVIGPHVRFTCTYTSLYFLHMMTRTGARYLFFYYHLCFFLAFFSFSQIFNRKNQTPNFAIQSSRGILYLNRITFLCVSFIFTRHGTKIQDVCVTKKKDGHTYHLQFLNSETQVSTCSSFGFMYLLLCVIDRPRKVNCAANNINITQLFC
jgi:hypothetical protein